MIHKPKEKNRRGVCAYHLCRKREKLFQCGWCGQFFCKKHLDPKPAGFPDFGAHNKRWKFTEEGRKTARFMEEWHKEEGHPCLPYTPHWESQIKESHEEEGRAFDRLFKPGTVAKNVDENSCYYHLCRKITELHQCKYCKEYFCKEHLEANPPGAPYHYIEGHPCAHHNKVDEERGQALDKLLGPKPLWFPKLEKEEPIHSEEETHNLTPPLHKKTGPSKNDTGLKMLSDYWYIIVFLIALMLFFGYLFSLMFSGGDVPNGDVYASKYPTLTPTPTPLKIVTINANCNQINEGNINAAVKDGRVKDIYSGKFVNKTINEIENEYEVKILSVISTLTMVNGLYARVVTPELKIEDGEALIVCGDPNIVLSMWQYSIGQYTEQTTSMPINKMPVFIGSITATPIPTATPTETPTPTVTPTDAPIFNTADSSVFYTTLREIVTTYARIHDNIQNNSWQPTESDTLFLKNLNKIIKFDGYLVRNGMNGFVYAVDRDGFQLHVIPPALQTLQIGVPGMVLSAKYHLTGKLYGYESSSIVIELTNAEFICSTDQMNPNIC